MTAGPRFDHYDWAGGREAMLRFGPDEGPVVVLALPLFEEANRTRAFGAAILRALAAREIGSVLPDLPGQGDSLVPLESLSLLRIQEGYEALVHALGLADRRAYGIGIRSGALLDAPGPLHGRWYLAPQGGPDLLRELRRIRQASVEEKLDDRWIAGPERPIEIAGNVVSTTLLAELAVTQPQTGDDVGSVRIVRLTGDPAAADRHVAGPALWRRSEPANDLDLAETLAEDIAAWIARCGG